MSVETRFISLSNKFSGSAINRPEQFEFKRGGQERAPGVYIETQRTRATQSTQYKFKTRRVYGRRHEME